MSSEQLAEGRGSAVAVTLWAGVLTLGVFLVLPLADLFSARPVRSLRLVPADTVRMPPPVVPRREVEPERIAMRKPPRPTPARSVPRPALPQPNLAMALPFTGFGGDFSLDFGLAPVGLVAGGELVFEIADLDEAPQPVARLAPVYPAQARMRRIEGAVVLEFLVDPAGRTADVTVVESTPDDTFVQSAVRAVTRWRFKPGRRAGAAVTVRVRQKVVFKLEDSP